MNDENKITIEPLEDAKLDELFNILADDFNRILRKIIVDLSNSVKECYIEKEKVRDAIDNTKEGVGIELKNLIKNKLGLEDDN